MTGYGRAVADVSRGGSSIRFVVEARSVNHRGFDLKIRSDEPDARCDVEIARTVKAAVERGSVTLHVRVERASAGLLDVERIRSTFTALERIRREVGLPEPVDLATVAAFLAAAGAPGTSPDDEGETWHGLRPAVEGALAELVAMRMREGAALRAELAERMDGLQAIVEQVDEATKPIPARFGPVGRKLDFVIQEIGREINTVGSKAQDASVGTLVIDGKAELEKMREQAQNIE